MYDLLHDWVNESDKLYIWWYIHFIFIYLFDSLFDN